MTYQDPNQQPGGPAKKGGKGPLLAIVIVVVLLVVGALLYFFVFKNSASPKSLAEDLVSGDITEDDFCGDLKDQSEGDFDVDDLKEGAGDDVEITVGEEKIDGDNATVTLTGKPEGGEETSVDAKFVKEDDAWKFCGFDFDMPSME
ncbi:hypothetical protein [Salininema proteolyticum]|uniref:DUF4878 domain-containing protein n=1 Tax=Salininema proteolyticum TaxID=1607685 RepID=A0ABV8TWZ1_9ACTN